MTTCIALLRGINVGGRNSVKMEALRGIFERLGFHDVRTYVQSGNVVFGALHTEDLSHRIEEGLRDSVGLPVTVLVRTAPELTQIMVANPFLGESGVEPAKLYVTFLARQPAPSGWEALRALPAGKDRCHGVGREVYLHCPDGYGRTKLSNTALERVLATSATTRNWATVGRLVEMARE